MPKEQFSFSFSERRRASEDEEDQASPASERPSAADEAEATALLHGPEATHVLKRSSRDRRAERARGRSAAQKIIDLLKGNARTTLPGTDPVEDAWAEGKKKDEH